MERLLGGDVISIQLQHGRAFPKATLTLQGRQDIVVIPVSKKIVKQILEQIPDIPREG